MQSLQREELRVHKAKQNAREPLKLVILSEAKNPLLTERKSRFFGLRPQNDKIGILNSAP
jgi:hypothetical protein